VIDALSTDPSYHDAFEHEFPAQQPAVSLENMIRAIAAFERSLIAGDSAFDRYVYAGEHDAISAKAKAGMALFYSARLGCGNCHAGFNFTGSWNERDAGPAPPAFACNGAGSARHRVPTLRNIAKTAPYMHDGRYATLQQVIEHYERVGHERPCAESRLRRFSLDPAERSDLRAFLESLSGPFAR
jgi:cytochrome c peroxidase